MKKPKATLAWAVGARAKISEPPVEQKQAGWREKDPISSAVTNWWQNNVFQWQQYFEKCTDQYQTASGEHKKQIAKHTATIETLKKRITWLEKAIKNIKVEPDRDNSGGIRLPEIFDPIVPIGVPLGDPGVNPRPRPGPAPRFRNTTEGENE